VYFGVIVKDVLQQALHFGLPSPQDDAPCHWAVGTYVKFFLTLCCLALQCGEEQLEQEDQHAWEISRDLLGGACSSKPRFKSSGDARNAVKSFKTSRN